MKAFLTFSSLTLLVCSAFVLAQDDEEQYEPRGVWAAQQQDDDRSEPEEVWVSSNDYYNDKYGGKFKYDDYRNDHHHNRHRTDIHLKESTGTYAGPGANKYGPYSGYGTTTEKEADIHTRRHRDFDHSKYDNQYYTNYKNGGYYGGHYDKNDYGYGNGKKYDYGKDYDYGKKDYDYGKKDYDYGKKDYDYGKKDYDYGYTGKK